MADVSAYRLGQAAAQYPAEASQSFLDRIMSLSRDASDNIGEYTGTLPYALLGMAKSFAAERATREFNTAVDDAKKKLKRHLLGKE